MVRRYYTYNQSRRQTLVRSCIKQVYVERNREDYIQYWIGKILIESEDSRVAVANYPAELMVESEKENWKSRRKGKRWQ